MSIVNLTPVPGIYSGSAINVSGTLDASASSVIYSTDGIAPTLAKYIAYDNLSPANPFIATVQDGRGNVVFDGGFPKFYSSNFNNATTFDGLTNTFKYFVNALKYIANPTKVAAGNKKILFLGDASASAAYSIKSDANGGFYTSITKICTIAGFTPTLQIYTDFSGSVIDMPYSTLDQYCAVMFFSTNFGSSQRISDAMIGNLVAFREAGNGIFIITDHGDSSDSVSNPNGFYYNANLIAKNYGARFSGNFDRTPLNVGFLIANYRKSPTMGKYGSIIKLLCWRFRIKDNCDC